MLEAQQKQTYILKECIQNIMKENTEVNVEVKQHGEDISILKAKCEVLERQNTEFKRKLVDLESRSRRDNLKIYNIAEKEKENVHDLRLWFDTFLVEKLSIMDPNIEVDRIHCIGKPGKGTRPIIVKFNKYAAREAVWNRRKELKDTGISMSEDFPEEIERKRRTLFPVMKAARNDGQRASLAFDKLYINEQSYTVDTLHQLPDQYKPENIAMKREGGYIFFFGKECPLSNFYLADFLLDGHKFNSTEQFIQYSKAKMFSDSKTAEEILREPEPSKQKALGRKVTNFDKKKWEESIETVVTRGIAQKFNSNSRLKKYLKDTGEARLVEASARDSLFGIGLPISNSDIMISSKWKGRNLQGTMLEMVRNDL